MTKPSVFPHAIDIEEKIRTEKESIVSSHDTQVTAVLRGLQ